MRLKVDSNNQGGEMQDKAPTKHVEELSVNKGVCDNEGKQQY